MSQFYEDKMSALTRDLDNVPRFIKVVFQLLEEAKYDELIGWSHDGRAVLIKNPTEFAEKLLPEYFKHNNLSSFIRQVTTCELFLS